MAKLRFKFQGRDIALKDPREMFRIILECVSPGIRCWSPTAVKEFLLGTLDMLDNYINVLEAESDQKLKKVNQFKRWKTNLRRRISNLSPDSTEMTKVVFSILLAMEGKGLLTGFGMSNKHGDKLTGNPEVHSIYDHFSLWEIGSGEHQSELDPVETGSKLPSGIKIYHRQPNAVRTV